MDDITINPVAETLAIDSTKSANPFKRFGIAVWKKLKSIRFIKPFFTIPNLILALVFTFIPLGFMVVMAFRGDDGFTLSNFTEFFTSPIVLPALGRSLLVALLTTLGCLLIAYPLALALANSKINKSVILVLMFILPMYMNSLMRTTALRVLFGLIGLDAPGHALIRIVLAYIYIFFPFMLLPIYTGLSNMDKSYIEASKDLGGNGFTTFLKVILPLSLPGVISGIFMVFMPAVTSFAIRDVLMSGIPGEGWYLFGNEIFRIIMGPGHDGAAAAYSIILLIVVFGIMIATGKFQAMREKKAGGKMNG